MNSLRILALAAILCLFTNLYGIDGSGTELAPWIITSRTDFNDFAADHVCPFADGDQALRRRVGYPGQRRHGGDPDGQPRRSGRLLPQGNGTGCN